MQRSRSREGAWIEISISASAKLHLYGGRSREGAWIEIEQSFTITASSAGRSREGAWIEIDFARRRGYEAEKSLP